MKNVLFIGPYRQYDGWGQSARNLIGAILSTNNNLTLRHITLADGKQLDSKLYDELEDKTGQYDIIVQNCLPDLFEPVYGVKNVGFFCIETSRLSHLPWIAKCNLMDEIWVHSQFEKDNLIESGVTVPIVVIGSGCNTQKYDAQHKADNGSFTFYFIGSGERKNINALITAFHREFGIHEPVDLLLKLTGPDHILRQGLTDFKSILGIYPYVEQYKQEQLITAYLTEKEIDDIHLRCDCFVMPSHGESWCWPAFDAAAFGNTVLTTPGGPSEFIKPPLGQLIHSRKTPVFCKEKPLPYLYTSRETWLEPDILHLQQLMRQTYIERGENPTNFYTTRQQLLQYYSLEEFGKRLNAIINS
jgi:hypothetical protein